MGVQIKKYNRTQMGGGVSEHRGAAGSKLVQKRECDASK